MIHGLILDYGKVLCQGPLPDRIAWMADALTLDRETFALVEATPTGARDGEVLSLRPAALMATIMAGVTGSLPHIPTAAAGGSRVAPPVLG